MHGGSRPVHKPVSLPFSSRIGLPLHMLSSSIIVICSQPSPEFRKFVSEGNMAASTQEYPSFAGPQSSAALQAASCATVCIATVLPWGPVITPSSTFDAQSSIGGSDCALFCSHDDCFRIAGVERILFCARGVQQSLHAALCFLSARSDGWQVNHNCARKAHRSICPLDTGQSVPGDRLTCLAGMMHTAPTYKQKRRSACPSIPAS